MADAKNWKVFTIDWVPAEKSSKTPEKKLEKTLNRLGARSIERMEFLEGTDDAPDQLLLVIDSDQATVDKLREERAAKKKKREKSKGEGGKKKKSKKEKKEKKEKKSKKSKKSKKDKGEDD